MTMTLTRSLLPRSGIEASSTTLLASDPPAPLFAPLGESERQALSTAFRPRRFRSGEVLFHEGDPGHALFFLRSGRVKIVQISEDGAEIILHVFGPGDWLGELSLVDGEPRSATAVALEGVEALALSSEEFRALLARHPAIAFPLLTRLAGMIRRLNEQMQALRSLDATGRLAQKLLELAEQHGQETPEGVRIALCLSQEQLAHMVGAARSTVNKQLGWFQERGILTVEREQITLHRPDLLRKRIQ